MRDFLAPHEGLYGTSAHSRSKCFCLPASGTQTLLLPLTQLLQEWGGKRLERERGESGESMEGKEKTERNKEWGTRVLDE